MGVLVAARFVVEISGIPLRRDASSQLMCIVVEGWDGDTGRRGLMQPVCKSAGRYHVL